MSAKSVAAVAIVIAIAAFFILPVMANLYSNIGKTRIPLISDLTYTARIQLLFSTEVRYNVATWHTDEGSLGASTVTLYYLGGQNEVFHWVFSYSFSRSF